MNYNSLIDRTCWLSYINEVDNRNKKNMNITYFQNMIDMFNTSSLDTDMIAVILSFQVQFIGACSIIND